MTKLSVLDLCPINEGSTASDALANSADLALHAEQWGYERFWLAEHHNMPGIGSAATAVVIGHVAAATSRIRVGAGGVMLPPQVARGRANVTTEDLSSMRSAKRQKPTSAAPK